MTEECKRVSRGPSYQARYPIESAAGCSSEKQNHHSHITVDYAARVLSRGEVDEERTRRRGVEALNYTVVVGVR